MCLQQTLSAVVYRVLRVSDLTNLSHKVSCVLLLRMLNLYVSEV